MRDYWLYFLYRAATAILTALPLRVVFRLGAFGGWCSWLVLGRYRRLSLRNLEIAFGNSKPRPELRRIARKHFEQLGANVLSSLKLGTMPVEEIEKHVQVENLELIHKYLSAGRPVILLLAHLGIWELCAQLMPKYIGYVRNATIYQGLRNRRIDEHLRTLRARSGVEMYDRAEGFSRPIKLLRGGGAIGILCDQHAGDKGIWVPFFSKFASTTPLPALLAKRTGAALVGIAFYTTGTARWRVAIGPAIEAQKNQSIGDLTSRANEIVQEQIESAPADWFWVHDRWKTPRPNFLLTRYKRGIHPADGAPSLKPFRLVVRSSNWLGDAVMSIPAVQAMKNGRPDCRVTIVCQSKLVPLWKEVAEVNDIVSIQNQSVFSTARAIRAAGPFDAAVVFPNSLRSALEIRLAGVPLRVGYRGHSRSWLLNQIVRKRRNTGRIEHQATTYLRIAHELGADIIASRFVRREPRKAGTGRLNLALCPGAEYGPAKRWLPERFAAVAVGVSAEKSAKWMLFGTAADAAAGEIVATALGENVVNRIGKTSLADLITELQSCRLLLTNDTGTMHLAAFLGIPTVALFGSTEPLKTAPLGDGHVIVRHHVECSPCFLRECPIDFRCMKAVTVEEVTQAVLSILKD
jgi:lipopolysaccharide heptosyltransferase II